MHYLNRSYTTYINIKKTEAVICFRVDINPSLFKKITIYWNSAGYIHLNPEHDVNKKEAGISKYKAFVEGVSVDELENPLKDVYGGFILSSKLFIKQTLDLLDDIRVCSAHVFLSEFV